MEPWRQLDTRHCQVLRQSRVQQRPDSEECLLYCLSFDPFSQRIVPVWIVSCLSSLAAAIDMISKPYGETFCLSLLRSVRLFSKSRFPETFPICQARARRLTKTNSLRPKGGHQRSLSNPSDSVTVPRTLSDWPHWRRPIPRSERNHSPVRLIGLELRDHEENSSRSSPSCPKGTSSCKVSDNATPNCPSFHKFTLTLLRMKTLRSKGDEPCVIEASKWAIDVGSFHYIGDPLPR